jgi:hypothetical protein
VVSAAPRAFAGTTVDPSDAMSTSDRRTPCWLITAFLAVTIASPIVGQRPVAPAATRDLQFGLLLPGLDAQVMWTDPTSSGRFEIRGVGGAAVRVDIMLPSALVSPGGDLVPLQFGSTDGGFGSRPSLRQGQTFDPWLPLVTPLGRSGKLYLWLGGTAKPSPTQKSGDYNATITVTVAYTGV